MKVKLARYTFPDRPDWLLVDTVVPLGTVYEVLGYNEAMAIQNVDYQTEPRPCPCYFATRPGDERPGWIPAVCFDPIEP